MLVSAAGSGRLHRSGHRRNRATQPGRDRVATPMASLRGAFRSGRALQRPHDTIPPLPSNRCAAGNPNPGLALGRSPRSLSPLPVEDGSAEVSAPGGDGDESKKKRGFRTLRSLFAPSSPVVPRSTGEAAVTETGGAIARRTSSRPRARPTESADYVMSVDVDAAEELSPEVALLIRRLHEEGYLKNPNFLEGADSGRVLSSGYARGVLVSAAQRFGEDNQDIAKWLSGSSLKRVALSGCPSTERKTVFAAKRLRSFFCVQEDIVCRGCVMKRSCKFVNQNVNRAEKLVLAGVMRVLTAYAADNVKSNPKLQKEINDYVSKSLKEVINLSS